MAKLRTFEQMRELQERHHAERERARADRRARYDRVGAILEKDRAERIAGIKLGKMLDNIEMATELSH